MADRKWYTTAQAAELLGVSPEVMTALGASGAIRRWRIGGRPGARLTRYLASDLNRHLGRLHREAGMPATPARYMSAPEVADYLGVSLHTLARYLMDGLIPGPLGQADTVVNGQTEDRAHVGLWKAADIDSRMIPVAEWVDVSGEAPGVGSSR